MHMIAVFGIGVIELVILSVIAGGIALAVVLVTLTKRKDDD